MGAIFKIKRLKTPAEVLIMLVLVAIAVGVISYIGPGLSVAKAKLLSSMSLNKTKIDNVTKGSMIPLPSKESAKFTMSKDGKVPSDYNEKVSTKVTSNPLNRIVEYAWNANAGMITANGGSRTVKGSLFEAAGINLEIVRQDGTPDISTMQVNFIKEYASGKEYPVGEKSAFGASIMGDGVAYYIATTQQSIDDKFGKGKYHLQVVGAYGMSDGEDKLIAPVAWKSNPQLMRGSVISSVIGDGDWVVAVNFAFANNIPVNPDIKTYDPDAVNFVFSENGDYINSVKELIKSQTTGSTIPLQEVKDGKLTGKTVNMKINAATTWTPGDKIAFDALTGYTDVVSTKDFTNQMACTLVVVKEWALQHEKFIISLLRNTYIASNQLKQYDDWAVFAAKATYQAYNNYESPKYWYDMFKGVKGNKAGVDYNIGGSRVMNYADALQYYGITDGNNRYKTVYEQVSKYLVELNPGDFKTQVKGGVIPYDDAVNLYFLKSINDIDAGTIVNADYSATKTTVLATGEWQINFATNSTAINTTKELETIYSLLMNAENTKVKIIGYTDNVGNSNSNLVLSRGRANSVKSWLVRKGIKDVRFQEVDGLGDQNPIAPNTTKAGQAKNRRCEISILK